MGRQSLAKWAVSMSVLALGAIMVTSIPWLRAPPQSPTGTVDQTMASASAVFRGRTSDGLARSAGTAFSVGWGLLVSNAHVTLPCTADRLPIRVGGYRGSWEVAHEDQALDLVLLRALEPSPIPALALSAMAHVQRDTRSLVLGFIEDGETAGAAKLYGELGAVRQATIMVHRPEAGKAESLRTTDRNGHPVDPTWRDGLAFFGETVSERMRWALEIAVTMGHGASGGPVVDSTGNVLAVVVADGTRRGLTSAITLADLTDFLAAADVVPQFAAPASGEADWNKAYQRAAPSVVRVGC
jgi:hypothetical protein